MLGLSLGNKLNGTCVHSVPSFIAKSLEGLEGHNRRKVYEIQQRVWFELSKVQCDHQPDPSDLLTVGDANRKQSLEPLQQYIDRR